MNEDKIRCSVYYKHKKIKEFKNHDLFYEWINNSKYRHNSLKLNIKGSNHMIYYILNQIW